jgi:predicted ferric reductase
MSGPLPWYVARASGLVAWLLLAGAMLWGLALSTKALGRRPRANWLLDMHRWLGGTALALTGVHVGALLLDQYVHFDVAAVLVPFASSWHPLTVAFGVPALYLLVAVELTSLARAHLSKRLWRNVHTASFPLFVAATAHGLTTGTDTKTFVALSLGMVACAAIIGLAAVRVMSVGSGSPSGRNPSRRPESLPV